MKEDETNVLAGLHQKRRKGKESGGFSGGDWNGGRGEVVLILSGRESSGEEAQKGFCSLLVVGGLVMPGNVIVGSERYNGIDTRGDTMEAEIHHLGAALQGVFYHPL